MKKIFFIHCLLSIAYCAFTQSVGIGTASPTSCAQLDVVSITKGFLMPRMTSVQRISIASPVAGLMVYDTDRKLFYQYDGSLWRLIVNSDFWNRSSATSNYIYNLGDSIGINTSLPTERLDVNGNIRSRNSIMADNNISADGVVSGGNVVSVGNMVVGGISSLSGDVSTNGDLIINSSTATLQLKSGNVNKGFFQLSGNDVRLGTNSGNTGDLIIRMNGSNRVQVSSAGDIDLDGKITRSAKTGVNSLLPVCYGFIKDDGTILSGSGNFSVAHTSTGQYTITCSDLNVLCVVIATSASGADFGIAAISTSPSTVLVETMNLFNFNFANSYFSFLIYKPG